MNDIMEKLVEVEFDDPDNFLKIKETLTRIGYSSVGKDKKSNRTLIQSCHIYHKRSKYYITHFKEMFLVDGQFSSMDDNDYGRRNAITKLLEDWGLLRVKNPEMIKSPIASISQIKIIPFKEKSNWNLISKYTIGNKTEVNYNK